MFFCAQNIFSSVHKIILKKSWTEWWNSAKYKMAENDKNNLVYSKHHLQITTEQHL